MDRVNIVSLYNIANYIYHESLAQSISRVKIFFITVGQEPFGMCAGDMVRRNGGCSDIEVCAVRVQPGVKFHSAFMRFFDHEYKRIIVREGRFTLGASKPLAPGFIRRCIKS